MSAAAKDAANAPIVLLSHQTRRAAVSGGKVEASNSAWEAFVGLVKKAGFFKMQCVEMGEDTQIYMIRASVDCE